MVLQLAIAQSHRNNPFKNLQPKYHCQSGQQHEAHQLSLVQYTYDRRKLSVGPSTYKSCRFADGKSSTHRLSVVARCRYWTRTSRQGIWRCHSRTQASRWCISGSTAVENTCAVRRGLSTSSRKPQKVWTAHVACHGDGQHCILFSN